MRQTVKKKKRRLAKYFVVLLLLLPGSAIALFGSENAVLTAILAEMKTHTLSLLDVFDGIHFLDAQIANMRSGIDDPLNLKTSGLLDREERMDELVPSTEVLYTYPFVHGLEEFEEIMSTVEDVWGKYPDTDYGKILRFKDYIPIYTFGQTALIAEEAEGFANTGVNLLEDLTDTTEGKATIRSAQAAALQVQQLAQIESNQALQISLQSQQVLDSNEIRKGIEGASKSYTKMLQENVESLKESEQ